MLLTTFCSCINVFSKRAIKKFELLYFMKKEIFPFSMRYLLHIDSLVPPTLQLQKREEKAIAQKQSFVTTYTHDTPSTRGNL